MKSKYIEPAADAANDGIRAAECALQNARDQEQAASAAERQAGNAVELAHDGLPAGGDEHRERYHASMTEYQSALAAWRDAVRNREVAESCLAAEIARAEKAKNDLVAPVMPTTAEIDAGFACDLAALEEARDTRKQAEKQLAEVRDAIAALDEEHKAALMNRGPIAKQGQALAEIAGKREALSVRLPEAEEAMADAEAGHAAVVPVVVAEINTRQRELQTSVQAAFGNLQKMVARPPVLRLVGKLNAARENVGTARNPGHKADLAEQYLAEWQRLEGPIRAQEQDLVNLAREIEQRFAEMEVNVGDVR